MTKCLHLLRFLDRIIPFQLKFGLPQTHLWACSFCFQASILGFMVINPDLTHEEILSKQITKQENWHILLLLLPHYFHLHKYCINWEVQILLNTLCLWLCLPYLHLIFRAVSITCYLCRVLVTTDSTRLRQFHWRLLPRSLGHHQMPAPGASLPALSSHEALRSD